MKMYVLEILDCSKLIINQKNDNDVTIWQHQTNIIIKFSDVVLSLLSGLVTGLSFMSKSSLV